MMFGLKRMSGSSRKNDSWLLASMVALTVLAFAALCGGFRLLLYLVKGQ
jgi:hypothetical protein